MRITDYGCSRAISARRGSIRPNEPNIMSDNKIKIGITHGDANGIGYEVIVKSLCDPRICELCTPVVYGSAKAAGYYKKQIEGAESLSFNIIGSAAEANPKRVNLIN